ncbi:hypoxanthine-guanine phosphoribosyltransferase [Spiroplasma corruscae]|uniref:Hypoxanthine phosphoribosyltransferase n=1 Tax=Spiroplasma corruscae TaxID=216934 RepID=A0A222EQ18_9MOLU|nr:hypoxanthine phosphoribosyltransferase [Spiroplasma corruscae]ASP28630.1 hypoxanthine-guanine phosphoribosyltransferase [Spiroplasma corruscae]
MDRHPLVKKVLVDKVEIDSKIDSLANEVNSYYKNKKVKDNTVVIIGLLKGCIPFMASLIKKFDFQCVIDFMIVSSYGGTLTNIHEPKILHNINTDIKDADVLIVEDIIDTGITLNFMKDYLEKKGAKEVKVITLASKPNKLKTNIKPDWNGFEFGDEFLIGYGLDYQERFRNLPYIAICDTDKLNDWEW